MRTVSATTQTETRKQTTQPIYVVELGFSSTLRYSTGGTLTWNGLTWIGNRIARDGVQVQTDANGNQSGSVTLMNQDLAVGAVVLNEGAADKVCRIWKLYGPGPHAVDDAVPLFDGVMDAVPELGDNVEISILSQGSETQFAPRLFAGPPLMNHNPPDGKVITWAGDRVTIRRRNG